MSTTKTQTKAEVRSRRQHGEERGTPEQQPMMRPQPQKEHEWLQRLVGEWSYEGEMTMEPGKPSVKFEGTENVRSLGELWILVEGQGEMPGCGSGTTVLTLGYDPHEKRFVGTFIGSIMTHMWVYDGRLDAAEKVLTLNTEGPSMTGDEQIAKFRDVIELESDDHRIMTSEMLGDDGKWHRFMTAHYRRA